LLAFAEVSAAGLKTNLLKVGQARIVHFNFNRETSSPVPGFILGISQLSQQREYLLGYAKL